MTCLVNKNVVANADMFGGFTDTTHIVAIPLVSVKFLFTPNHLEFCSVFQASYAKGTVALLK